MEEFQKISTLFETTIESAINGDVKVTVYVIFLNVLLTCQCDHICKIAIWH